MKSYYSHLQSVKMIGESVDLKRKPVFRSSAIFPVMHTKDLSTKITLLGYWLIKRGIKEIGLLLTLRDQTGVILHRQNLTIDCVKVFNINLYSYLLEMNIIEDFVGSIELEVFSSRDMVFPYPAFVIAYFGDEFSTAVHTTGRVYNDIEDLSATEERRVAESGFDIIADGNHEPFFAFVNGPVAQNNEIIIYEVSNHNGESFKGKFNLPELKPYGTYFIYLNEFIELENMLIGKSGSIKIHHQLKGFFPRFISGNFMNKPKTMSITHSYYDCSECMLPKDYWERKADNYFDSSISVPLFLKDNFYTDLIFYPIFSPSSFYVSFEFYDNQGKKIFLLKDHLKVSSDNQKYCAIRFRDILANSEYLDTIASARIIVDWRGAKIPTRLKLGLNIGQSNLPVDLPCNICFAPSIGNPNVDKKPSTFKWAPLLNFSNSVFVLNNSSPQHSYNKSSNLTVKFFRDQDDSFVERQLVIPPFGQKVVTINEDLELKSFFNQESGWVTIQADNPNTHCWYFDFHDSGAVAGDHSF